MRAGKRLPKSNTPRCFRGGTMHQSCDFLLGGVV